MSPWMKSTAYSGQDQEVENLLAGWGLPEVRVAEANRVKIGVIILNKDLNHDH